MTVKQSIVVFLAAAVMISFCAGPSSAGPPAKAAIPDFTEGGQTDGSEIGASEKLGSLTATLPNN